MDAYNVKHKSKINSRHVCRSDITATRDLATSMCIHNVVIPMYIATILLSSQYNCLRHGTWHAQKVLPLILSYV